MLLVKEKDVKMLQSISHEVCEILDSEIWKWSAPGSAAVHFGDEQGPLKNWP